MIIINITRSALLAVAISLLGFVARIVLVRQREDKAQKSKLDERARELDERARELDEISKLRKRSVSIAFPLLTAFSVVLTAGLLTGGIATATATILIALALGLFVKDKFDQIESSLSELTRKVEDYTRNSPQ